jgi:hypothetical protein
MNHLIMQRNLIAAVLVFLLAACTYPAIGVRADELPRAKATIPDNFVEVRSGLGGAYYVDGRIKKRYDELFAQVQALQADVQQARISETDAQGRIDRLRKEIQQALAEIREKEIFVTPATVHKKRESQTFALGPASVLLVKAEQVQIVGWDKPHAEAILEKVVLSADSEPAAGELEAIKVVHRQMTGAKALDRASREQRTEALLKLTPELFAKQRSVFLSMYRWYARLDPETVAKLPASVADDLRVQPSASPQLRLAEHLPFESIMDETIDVVEVDGLSYQAGNRNISLDIRGKDVGKSSAVWRRHARLTLYAPKCKLVAVYGGHEGIDIQSVDAAVEVQMQNVPRSDTTFRVKGVQGSLVARDVPWQLVENVTLDVDVIHTDNVANTSGPHFDDVKGAVSNRSEKTSVYRKIGGHLVGWFVQSNLYVDSVAKEVDIRNDFGDTVWTHGKSPPSANYRIVTECGAIQMRIPNSDTLKLPVMALAEVGDVFVPSDMKQLESLSYSLPGEHDVMHGWQGFATKLDASDHMETYNRMQRVAAILRDEPRSPGIDLVTRAGSVRILVASPPADN